MTYLITCSSNKQHPAAYNPASLHELSFHNLLGHARQQLLELHPHIELNWNQTLPAWKLYSGPRSKFYTQVAVHNWQKECISIKILSALFGWVNHTDLLPLYNLQMGDLIPGINQSVYNYWLDQNLLIQFVDPNDIDLLTNKYRMAISGAHDPVALQPDVHFIDRYGTHKGIWFNNQLEMIVCN